MLQYSTLRVVFILFSFSLVSAKLQSVDDTGARLFISSGPHIRVMEPGVGGTTHMRGLPKLEENCTTLAKSGPEIDCYLEHFLW